VTQRLLFIARCEAIIGALAAEHADDYSTILADVTATEAEATTAFANASTDLAGGETAAGSHSYQRCTSGTGTV
jgi:hypothetical protein